MPRHAHYVPHGVIPAVLLPFTDDLAIDEKNFRKHLSDVAATDGLSAITINAHSTEVASCSFDEQRRVLDIARDQIGDRIPLIVDGGPTGRTLPTTLVDLSLGEGRWEILREGAIPTHEVVMVLQR